MDKRAFTLIEALTATFIAVYVLTGAWSAYMMSWTWYHEINPEVEAQRIARIAISTIINGNVDSTAGTYSIGPTVYRRRNGISQAVDVPTLDSPQSISFRLEPDAGNDRNYYLGVDSNTGLNVVYYSDSDDVIHKITATIGITDLIVEKFEGRDNMIKVTAIVQRDILGTGTTPYRVNVTYSEVAYLRNVAS